MNRKLLATALVAAAGFASAPGFAAGFVDGEIGYVPQAGTPMHHMSNTTRTEVQSDYMQAMRNDALVQDGEVREAVPTADARTDAVSRAAVREGAIDTARHAQPRDGEG